MKKCAILLLLLTGCEMIQPASEAPPIILPPSPAGSGFEEAAANDSDQPSSAAVNPAGNADEIAELKRMILDLQKKLCRPPDATVEPNASPDPQTAPVVYVFTRADCAVCPRVKKAVEGLREPIFQFKEESEHPAWLKGVPNLAFPVFYWEAHPGDWRRFMGWPGLQGFLSIYNLSKAAAGVNRVSSPSATVPAAARVHYPLYYGRLPSVYDWPGDLRVHLRTSPHNLSPQAIDGMTDQQCIQWHDSWHIQREGGRRRTIFRSAA